MGNCTAIVDVAFVCDIFLRFTSGNSGKSGLAVRSVVKEAGTNPMNGINEAALLVALYVYHNIEYSYLGRTITGLKGILGICIGEGQKCEKTKIKSAIQNKL